MQQRKAIGGSMLFGAIWFIASIIILVLHFNGSLGDIQVPRIIWVIYEVLEIVPGAIVQMLLSGIIIAYNVFLLITNRAKII